MIVNSDNNSLLIIDKNKLIIRNLNEYNIMKYQDFNGNRIIVKIGKCDIVETYNEGIFNVSFDKISMQIRDPNDLCKRIKFNDENYIIELLKNENKDKFNMDFLLKSLSGYHEFLKFTDHEIIINNMFSVDKNGQAYYFTDPKFKNKLCIVASNLKKLDYKTEIGNIIIDFRTLEIIHKVLFLISPNINDSIFINQLPIEIKKIIVGKK